MRIDTLKKIEDNFYNIYDEMINIGIIKHKKHQVRIAKYVHVFMKWVHKY